MKPYFLPLKTIYYEMFLAGSQDCEIRPANHRGWNRKNIYPGRPLLLSKGYGNVDRHYRDVVRVVEGPASVAFNGVPQWHIDAVSAIYGDRDSWLVAYVGPCMNQLEERSYTQILEAAGQLRLF